MNSILMLLISYLGFAILDTMNFSGRSIFTINEQPFTVKDLLYTIVLCTWIYIFYIHVMQITHM